VASYDGDMLKVTLLFNKTILLSMFLWRLHDCVIIHLSATGVAEIAESTKLKGCPLTFAFIVSVTNYNPYDMIRIAKCMICYAFQFVVADVS
jgi:hypothetical protein